MSVAAKITINRPWWSVGKTQWGGTPFATLGLAYCIWCKMEVDTDTEAHSDGNDYVFRRNCKRCGKVQACGAVRAPIISGMKGLPPKSLTWIHDVKKDRR